MRPIENFDKVQAAHGRNGGRLKADTYIIRIDKATEDVTGYGASCLKLVYDVAEGDNAGFFADIAGQEENDWRHTIEVDLGDGNGRWLKCLIEAVIATYPDFVWNWDESSLVGKYVGVTFQERQTTAKRGKNKGKMQSYLDLWDFISIERVRAGDYEVPPVNDKRDYDAEAKAQAEASAQAAPVSVPQGMSAQAPVAAVPGAGVPGAGVTGAGVPAGVPQTPAVGVPGAAQVPGAAYPQAPVQQVPAQQGDFASQDIPF